MSHLTLQGDNFSWPGFSLLGESSLAITLDETGIGNFNELDFLILSGTTTVGIGSVGPPASLNRLFQLAETDNSLTTVTISDSEDFFSVAYLTKQLRRRCSDRHRSQGDVADQDTFFADAHRCVGDDRQRGQSLQVRQTRAALVTFAMARASTPTLRSPIPGSRSRAARAVTSSRTTPRTVSLSKATTSAIHVHLGGAGAKATLGTGYPAMLLTLGLANLGTNEAPGTALGDNVKFGSAATAELFVGSGAEAGSTAGTTSIGLTKVLDAAAGMGIGFKTSLGTATLSTRPQRWHRPRPSRRQRMQQSTHWALGV